MLANTFVASALRGTALGDALDAFERGPDRVGVAGSPITRAGNPRRNHLQPAFALVVDRFGQSGPAALQLSQRVGPAGDGTTEVADIPGQFLPGTGDTNRRRGRPPPPAIPAAAPISDALAGCRCPVQPPATHALGTPLTGPSHIRQQGVHLVRRSIDLDRRRHDSHGGMIAPAPAAVDLVRVAVTAPAQVRERTGRDRR
jgi:hypothetical protein